MNDAFVKKDNLQVYSFYRFLKIDNKEKIKLLFDHFFKNKHVKGTILLADEGINASISSTEDVLQDTMIFIKKILKIKKINLKINNSDFFPFNKFKVRLKKEIVSLGVNEIRLNKNCNNYILPATWDKFVSKKGVKLIDTRNIYEIKIGKFSGAINPKIKTFREFPSKVQNLGLKKNDMIAMYCTGGIRCEKASAFLKSKGFKNVYQLDGGIINYLQEYKCKIKNSQWSGECFVFDNRVTVNRKLNKGKYEQCYGCRNPITKKDMVSKKYKKGVYCPLCFDKRTEKQKKSSEDRQQQIEKYMSKS